MTTQTHIIDSGNNGFGMNYPKEAEQHKLVCRHNAGFFSCCTVALQDIAIWSRQHKKTPDILDRHAQFSWYMAKPNQSLINHFFAPDGEQRIDCGDWFELGDTDRELQYTDYRNLNFDIISQFRDKYFTPSQYILDKVAALEEKYKIDYENTCGVLYRSNDKARECAIAPYEDFEGKAATAHAHHDLFYKYKLNYLIAPDETQFLEHFTNIFGNTLCMDETAHMPKKDSCIPLELPYAERAEQAANFFATVLMLAKCKYLITHSGNVSLWCCLYRGHMEGVSQWRDGVWL